MENLAASNDMNIINAKDDFGDSAFVWATHFGHASIMEFLLSKNVELKDEVMYNKYFYICCIVFNFIALGLSKCSHNVIKFRLQ